MTLARKLYEASCEQMPVRQLPPWERLHADAHAHWEALASVATSALTGSDAATANAQLDALANAVAELLPAIEAERADRKDFEFSTAEMQERKRRTTRLIGKVKAELVSAGRRIP